MKTIQFNKVVLVRESAHRYNLPTSVLGPKEAVKAINELMHLDTEAQEVFVTLFLDVKNHITGIHEVARGILSAAPVHPREVFKAAILSNAAAMIIAHNHPSGDPQPSSEDRQVTRRLLQVGKLTDIPVIDSIIIGENKFYSFKEKGILN